MALPRGFQEHLPFGEVRIAFFFAILGGVKYKISLFGSKAKMKPTKYPYSLPRG